MYDPCEVVEITIEYGLMGGYPRQWHGDVVTTLYIPLNMKLSDYLNKVILVMSDLPKGSHNLPIGLGDIRMGDFKPSSDDMSKMVGELGLESGTLRISNGKSD